MNEESIINPVVDHKCETCIHYLQDKKCTAFWGDIPEDIWTNKKEHNKVLPDQLLDDTYKSAGGVL